MNIIINKQTNTNFKSIHPKVKVLTIEAITINGVITYVIKFSFEHSPLHTDHILITSIKPLKAYKNMWVYESFYPTGNLMDYEGEIDNTYWKLLEYVEALTLKDFEDILNVSLTSENEHFTK